MANLYNCLARSENFSDLKKCLVPVRQAPSVDPCVKVVTKYADYKRHMRSHDRVNVLPLLPRVLVLPAKRVY